MQTYCLTVRANRLYQLAICSYKHQKYGILSENEPQAVAFERWKMVDLLLYDAINAYQAFTFPIEGKFALVFIDLIVRLTICRSHVAQQQKKLLTAEKLLDCAQNMIQLALEDPSQFAIERCQDRDKLRLNAPMIPLGILQQKLLYKQGEFYLILRKESEARACF